LLTIESVDHVGDKGIGERKLCLGQTARLAVKHRHHHRQTSLLLFVRLNNSTLIVNDDGQL